VRRAPELRVLRLEEKDAAQARAGHLDAGRAACAIAALAITASAATKPSATTNTHIIRILATTDEFFPNTGPGTNLGDEMRSTQW
jgi:hypothetical protein